MQRCEDIAQLVWPITAVLCIGTQEGNKAVEVTDGWWFTKVQVSLILRSKG